MASSEYVVSEADAIASVIDAGIDEDNLTAILGDQVADLGTDAEIRPPRVAAIAHVLASDLLHAAVLAINADNTTSAAEVEWVAALAGRVAGFLSRTRPEYRGFASLKTGDVFAFLARFRRDRQPFGMACAETHWRGLEVCRRAAVALRDSDVLDRYERVIDVVLDGVTQLGGASAAELEERRRVVEIIALRGRLDATRAQTEHHDARVAAFCSAEGLRVYSSIAYAHQVWERDPFDVQTIHADARYAFEGLLDSATSGSRNAGHILLIRGGAGSGKTHLVRAFRNLVHGRRLGFAGYMQMTSNTGDYARYALGNVIDSLQVPYDKPEVQSSGLMVLSDGLAALIPEDDRIPLDGPEAVLTQVDVLLRRPTLSTFDPDLLAALLHLQRRDPPVTARAVKYLRCQDLSEADRNALGGLIPRTGEDRPLTTLIEMGRLIAATTGGAMVLLLDQLEDIFNLDQAKDRFPRAVDVVRSIVDGVPNAVVVISCLDDMYVQVRRFLTRAALDRIEREPEPITLTGQRSAEEIEDLVARRLRVLYNSHEVRFRDDTPLYPFRRVDLARLKNLRTRDVLNWCHAYRSRSIAAGALAIAEDVAVRPLSGSRVPATSWSTLYNDARSEFAGTPPDDDASLIDLLAFAAAQCDLEGADLVHLTTQPHDGRLRLEIRVGDDAPVALVVGICNRSAIGGALERQIDEVAEAAQPLPPALVRSGPFPLNPRTQIAKRLGEIVGAGGRRVVVQDADWRTIMAFSAFREQYGQSDGFAEWVSADRPMSRIASLRELFGLPQLTGASPQAESDPPPTPSDPVPPPAILPTDGGLHLGRSSVGSVTLGLAEIGRHVALVGIPALIQTLVERAIDRRFDVIVVDRRGGLSGMARPDAWSRVEGSDDVALHLFTPGQPEGRIWGLPLLPPTLAESVEPQRGILARQAAEAVGALMGYHDSDSERARLVILGKALDLLASRGGGSLADLIDLVDRRDPELLNAIGHLNERQFERLHDNLVALGWSHAEILDAGSNSPLATLGGTAPTLLLADLRFLGDERRIEYWLARMLLELGARPPQDPPQLNTVLVIVDAELALPTHSRPATREPLIELLRSGSSRGIGVVLGIRDLTLLDPIATDLVGTWGVGEVDDPAVAQRFLPQIDRRASTGSVMWTTSDTTAPPVELTPRPPDISPEAYDEDDLLALASATAGSTPARRS